MNCALHSMEIPIEMFIMFGYVKNSNQFPVYLGPSYSGPLEGICRFSGGARVILTYKTRIVPTLEQVKVLWDLSERCRLLYNFSLQERLTRWQQEKTKPKEGLKFLTYLEQQNALPQLKARFPEYRWVYSKVLQLVLRTLNADFKSFVSLRKNGDLTANPPRFKGKCFFTTLKYNQSGFKVRDGVLTLSHNYPSKV